MSTPVIVSNDDVALSVTLRKNGSTFAIDPGATVIASLILPDRSAILIDSITQSNAVAGADWANSLVMVVFTATQTAFDYSGSAVLEIQVDDGGKTTFFAAISAVKDTIT